MRLVVIGAGGHAKVVVDAAFKQGKYELVGFVDDMKHGQSWRGCPIKQSAVEFGDCHFVVALGDNKLRKQKYESLLAAGLPAATIVHPGAIVSPSVEIGSGTVVFAGSVINPDTKIGENCIINTAASIDHDCLIGSHTHIAPGAHLAGQITVGEGAFLGIGAVVAPMVKVGAWAVAGAGAVLIRDACQGETIVGVPARVLHKG